LFKFSVSSSIKSFIDCGGRILIAFVNGYFLRIYPLSLSSSFFILSPLLSFSDVGASGTANF